MSSGKWDEVFEEEEAKHFVGRHEELASFRQQISLSKPRYLIFYITGQGGVGKTTLLNRFRERAEDYDYLLADCDEHQRDVPVVLGHFAHQLTQQSFPLKQFDSRYKIYRQKMHEIESDPAAPQGLASGIVRTAVHAIFIGGDVVPGARKLLEYVPRETVETQASEWATYLIKKFTNKDEVELVREPASILTPLFFEDLNEIAQKRKVLLCFDNFEAATIELLEWLLRLREFKPSLNVRIILASRDEPGVKWDSLRSAIQTVRLDVFTPEEAKMFLDVNGITSSKRREEILELTGRLPVLMSWLAVPGGQTNEAASSIPTHDIVDRFLRWIDDVTLKRVALLGALPRIFNADILNLLLEGPSQTVDVQSAFDWLQTMPFVKQGQTGWYYHEVVRRMMLQYQRKKSPITYHSAHSNLADFYIARSRELISFTSSTREEWTNEQWRMYMLAYIYHFLVADPVRHWTEIMNLFVIAMRKHRSFAIEVIELLNLDDVQDELSNEQKSIVQLFRQRLRAAEDAVLADGFEMFDKLCAISDLSDQAKSYAFAYRGECHRLNNKWEMAISDFNSALLCIPDDTWAMARRGDTYQAMQRYEEALADFDRAITLDEKDAWAIGSRGVTYLEMKRYEEALADLDRSIALDEKDAWVIGNRGATYLEMKRYEEALADFDKAIALDEKNAWAIGGRGATYLEMRRCEEALVDFDKTIALDEKNAWAMATRGITYREMERYEEALADLDRAIALGEKDAWAIAHRGVTYLEMKRYEEALADLDRSIALDEKDAWVIGNRGATYLEMKRYEEALADLDRSIALGEKDARAIARRGVTYREMKRYEEALADFERALALDSTLDWVLAERGETHRLMGHYTEALADFEQATALDEKDAWMIANRGATYHAMRRYEEALADFKRAIALDEKDAWAIANRGVTYRAMRRYEEALKDFDRAIALDEKETWVIANRGVIYREMKRYEEALADFNQAIALDENKAWVIGSRGVTYREMQRYEEALADFERALTLDEKDAWAIGNRGETYRLMRRYEEALADFDRAIALDESNAWYRNKRALVYFVAGRKDDYESDLRVAIELLQTRLLVAPNNWGMNFALALCKLAAEYSDAESLYEQLASTCSSISVLQRGIDDLEDFLLIQSSHQLALRIRMRLQVRINEINESSFE